jgi:Family of unknown function (DUF5996)
VALDEDEEHATYDPVLVEAYFAAATQAALALAAFRAPYRGRSTPVNAWWGSFDLAVNLFSGETAEPPAQDFIMRNAMDAQKVAVGWWPGDARYDRAAFYATRTQRPTASPMATWSRRRCAGSRRWASTCSTGRTSARQTIPTQRLSNSPARRFATAARSASGIRASVRVPRASHRCAERKSSDPRRWLTPLSACRGRGSAGGLVNRPQSGGSARRAQW